MRKINMQTIAFMKEIEELKEKTLNGIKPFNEANLDNFNDYIFYIPEDGDRYEIVLNACLQLDHHDAISYYDNWYVVRDEEDNLYVAYEQDDYVIIIENGKWYLA